MKVNTLVKHEIYGIGTVVETNVGTCGKYVRVDFNGCTHRIKKCELEIIHRYNIGDRVIRKSSGRKGTIVDVPRNGYTCYEVKEDERAFNCRWAEENFELLTEEIHELKFGDKLKYGEWIVEIKKDKDGLEQMFVSHEVDGNAANFTSTSNGWFRLGDNTGEADVWSIDYIEKQE